MLPGGLSVDSVSLGSFMRGLKVVRFVGFAGFLQVRPGFRRVHSLLIRIIWPNPGSRRVHSVSLGSLGRALGSSGSFGFVSFI